MRLGLGGRLTLAIVCVLVLIQAIGLAAALRLRAQDGPAWRPPMPSRIAAAADALDALPAATRDSLLVALNGDDTRFRISPDLPRRYRPHDGPPPAVFRGYQQAIPGRELVLLAPRGRRDWNPPAEPDHAFAVRLADRRWLVVTPGVSQRRRSFTMAFFGLALLMTIASAILTWRLVRLATARLEAISRAAEGFAADLSAPPMAETGPPEARRVSAALNRMRADIRRLMDERMRMLAAVAHDLKTLLTRLRLRMALIEDEAQRARGDRDIADMAALIEDVLQVARGETRRPALVPTDVEAVVRDLAEARREAGDPVSLGAVEPAHARADAALLRRVLENLVDNAVFYAGAAEIACAVTSDGQVELRVVDHGPGIADGFREEAFQPFTRQETSRSRDTGGAGLGLSIARSLARQMEGDVELVETPGGGVTAILRLRSV